MGLTKGTRSLFLKDGSRVFFMRANGHFILGLFGKLGLRACDSQEQREGKENSPDEKL